MGITVVLAMPVCHSLLLRGRWSAAGCTLLPCMAHMCSNVGELSQGAALCRAQAMAWLWSCYIKQCHLICSYFVSKALSDLSDISTKCQCSTQQLSPPDVHRS